MMAGDRDVPTLMPAGAADSGAASPRDERLLRAIGDLSDAAICLVDAAGTILTWNSGAVRLFDYTPDEIVGRDFSCLFPHSARMRADPASALEQAHHQGRFEDVGWRINKSGQQVRVHTVITPVPSAEQQTEDFLVVIRDGDEPYRLLVGSLQGYGMYLLDSEGTIQTWNAGAESVHGFTAQEILGKHISIFYPGDDVAAEMASTDLEQAVRDGFVEQEGWRARKDGSLFWASTTLTSVRGPGGVVTGFSVVIRDLSERRASEESLRQSEERYRMLVAGVKDYAIFMLDTDGYVVTWNDGAQQLKGYSAGEIIGQHFSRFYPQEAVARRWPWEELERVKRDGRLEDEGWRVRKDGSRFWANVVITALRNENGRLIGFSKITRDLSERRAAEEALRESEERYRLLVAGVKDYAIFMLDTEGNVVTWNEGAQRLKGYSAEEIVGRHFSTFYPPEAIAIRWPWEELERVKRDGRFEDEGWRVRQDGSRFWANVVITALRDHTGRLIGFSKVTRDLSDRRAAEQALRDSEERYRLLVAGVKDYAIFMLDPEGHVVTWNEGAQRLKGYSAEEIVGRHFSTFYPADAVAVRWPWEELERAKRDGRLEDEGWRVRNDGSQFWANVIITALRDEAGRLIGFSKVTRDLTERRRAEQEIRALNEELQRKVDALAEANRIVMEKSAENEAFVYSVSHDLRSPLVNLQGFSHEMMYSASDLREVLNDQAVPRAIRERAESVIDSGIADSVKHVQTSVAHLGAIIEGLLRLSRAGRVEYQWTRVPLKFVVERIVTALSGTAGQRNAEIVVHDLPDVWGDPAALEQLFSNLISNALNYLDPGRKGCIAVGAAPANEGEYLIFVRDNGVGLTAAAQSRLFRVFQRFHPDLGPGEGMGLAIAHRIVERHNGRIWVESGVGEGATFFVALPMNQAQTSGQNSDGLSK